MLVETGLKPEFVDGNVLDGDKVTVAYEVSTVRDVTTTAVVIVVPDAVMVVGVRPDVSKVTEVSVLVVTGLAGRVALAYEVRIVSELNNDKEIEVRTLVVYEVSTTVF